MELSFGYHVNIGNWAGVDEAAKAYCTYEPTVTFEEPEGLTVIVKYPDGSTITPDTAILYDDDWNEIKRLYPLSNEYTFAGLSAGTYNTEAYKDNMFIGDVENIEVRAGETQAVTLTTYHKRYLNITVYSKADSASVEGVTLKIYSWDGYNEKWAYEYQGKTNRQGNVTFSSI
jgi:hypothetical protein